MVVGAINDNAEPVTRWNGGFENPVINSYELGSNFGPCVEAWAPGKAIYSTWSEYPN